MQKDWSFSGIIKGSGIIRDFEEFEPIPIKDIKEKSSILNKIEIERHPKHRYEVIYDKGKIVLTVEYVNFPPRLEAHISANKINVANENYEDTLNILNELVNLLKLSFLEITEEKYTLTIKSAPGKQMNNSSSRQVIVEGPIEDPSFISISTNEIKIISKDFKYLMQEVKKF